MRILVLTILTVSSIILNAQNIEKMSGKVFIDLEKGKISQSILITNTLKSKEAHSFLLHKYMVIDAILLNGHPVIFRKDSLRTHYLCNYYTLLPEFDLNKEDSLQFLISGEFHIIKDTTNKYTFRSDHDIIESYSIFRANGLSAWHPVLIEDMGIPLSEMMKAKKINYNLRLSCNEENIIYAGVGQQPETHYQLTGVQNLPMIIAGDYTWIKAGKIILINIDSTEQNALIAETNNIIRYYEELTDLPFSADPLFVKVEMDFGLEKEFAFYSYPATVFVNKRGYLKVGNNMMTSHELAHYYFGNVFVPKSNLYWFLCESITEYFSLKYLINSKNTSVLAEKYQTIKMLKQKSRNPFRKSINGYDYNFVRLDKVNEAGEVHEIQRYIYSPFQLLGMENEIGEENMMAFIKSVYSELNDTDDGYSAIISTLQNIGINHKTIRRIERKYIKRLSLREYRFLESVI